MGRVRRQRKYKACDPFSKQQLSKDDKYDRPPSKKQLKDDDHFKETASYHKFQQSIERIKKKKNRQATDKETKHSDVAHKKVVEKTTKERQNKESKNLDEQLPHETQKEYLDRLDKDIQNALTAAYSKNKKLRKKRKEHLKAREEKKKEAVKKKQEESTKDFNALKDTVKFGERVDAPPSLTAAPRKSQPSISKNSDRGLQLTSMLERNAVKDKKSDSMKRRRDMTETEKASFDSERQRVIDAYRLSKKKKEMKGIT